MRFRLEHRFTHARDRVEDAILDPAYQEILTSLPNVGERRITEHETRPDGTVHRRIRYVFAGELPGAVVRAVGTKHISWDEISLFDRARHTIHFHIEPKVFEHGFECRGEQIFEEDGSGTLRTVDTDLRVKVPVVGRLVENAIKDGFVRSLDAEASMLEEYLSR